MTLKIRVHTQQDFGAFKEMSNLFTRASFCHKDQRHTQIQEIKTIRKHR